MNFISIICITTTKTSSKLLAIPVMAVLLTLTIATIAPDAFATSTCSGSGNHCYANIKKDVDNRGGYGTIDINASNSEILILQ